METKYLKKQLKLKKLTKKTLKMTKYYLKNRKKQSENP